MHERYEIMLGTNTTVIRRSSCPEYAFVAYILLPIVVAPFLFIAYLLHKSVTNHAVFIHKGGNLFSRYKDAMLERRETWGKYCGLGFIMALNSSYTDAKENGEWKVRSVYAVYVCIYSFLYVCMYVWH